MEELVEPSTILLAFIRNEVGIEKLSKQPPTVTVQVLQLASNEFSLNIFEKVHETLAKRGPTQKS